MSDCVNPSDSPTRLIICKSCDALHPSTRAGLALEPRKARQNMLLHVSQRTHHSLLRLSCSINCNIKLIAMQGQERWIDALADCGWAVALEPTYTKARSRQGLILESLRRPAAAAKALQECLPTASATDAPGIRRRVEAMQGVSERLTHWSAGSGPMQDHFRSLHLSPHASVRSSDPCQSSVSLAPFP